MLFTAFTHNTVYLGFLQALLRLFSVINSLSGDHANLLEACRPAKSKGCHRPTVKNFVQEFVLLMCVLSVF